MQLGDMITSWIRTIIPALVGLIIVQLANLGVDIDSGALTVVIDGAVIGLYYVAVRFLENWKPFFGVLLGVPKAPTYTGTHAA